MPSMAFFEEEAVQAPAADDGEAEPAVAPHDVGYGFAERPISSALPETVPKVPDASDEDPDAEIAPEAQAAAESSTALLDRGSSTDVPQRQLPADSEPPSAFSSLDAPLAVEPPLSAPSASGVSESEQGHALVGARAEGGATGSAHDLDGSTDKVAELGDSGEGRSLIGNQQIVDRRPSQPADYQDPSRWRQLPEKKQRPSQSAQSANYQDSPRWQQLSEKEWRARPNNDNEHLKKPAREPQAVQPQVEPQAVQRGARREAAQRGARHEAGEIPLRYAEDQFVQEADAELGPKHGGHCTPKCTWSCDKPVCDEVCEPVCKAPKCETRCNSITTAGCAMECKKPHCAVVCPKLKSSRASGPSCTTQCSEPQCKLQCPQSQSCRNVCEQPFCEYDCKAPENCPVPKCKMVCEVPKKCRSSSFHETLPPLQAGQVAVQTFRAPAPTRQTQEATQMQPSRLPMMEVRVQSPSQHKKVFMPMLQDREGADAFEPF